MAREDLNEPAGSRGAAAPGPNGALVFVGFMGAGKSTAARAAADALRVRAVDTDFALEQELGMAIPDFFAAHGEEAFREREAELVRRVLDGGHEGVVALGGGALQSESVREALRSHTAVLLDVDAATAWARVGGRANRPLAQDPDAMDALLAQRAPLYERCADAILPTGRREVIRASLPFLLALGRAPAGTRLLWARSDSGDYPVFAGPALLEERFWPWDRGTPRRLCVTDRTVGELYGPALEPVHGTVTIEPGERHKTIATAEHVWSALARAGMTRDDIVVALGGGVVGDLAGFCAATYQRGVPVVQVPTTLVAQVDSAYGGKTGVDLPEAKNYVGAYHQPAGVLADPATLLSLPPGELAAGYAEVVKTALIAGGALWDRVREGGAAQPDVVLACARTKLAVVAEDERDAGRRQVLNLGHTVGHAIETATGYARYRHGEAVALGLLAALRLSGQDGLRAQVAELLAAHRLPARLEGVDVNDVIAATERDKKRRGDGPVPFVLVHGPGDVRHGERVADDDLRAAVEELAA